MIRFHCAGCGHEIETPDDYAGRSARCPTCGRKLRVPRKSTPDADAAALDLEQTPSGSGTVFRVDGRLYQVKPKLEGLLIAASAILGLSIAVFLAIGLTAQVYTPWFLAGLVASGFALFGALLCLPAYHSIRRSRGRKSGERLAFANVALAAVLVVVFLLVALLARYVMADNSPCRQRLTAVYKAFRQYADRNGGLLPPKPEVLVEQHYLAASKLTCPMVAGVREGTPTYLEASWRRFANEQAAVDFRTDVEPFPGDLVILVGGGLHEVKDQTTGRRTLGRYVLTVDGTVGYVPAGDVEQVLRQQDRIIGRVLANRLVNEGERSKGEPAEKGEPGDGE